MPDVQKLTGRDRIVRILEDGWTIYADDERWIIRIDDRKDEDVPADLIRTLVLDGTLAEKVAELAFFPGGRKVERHVRVVDLARGPEAGVLLRFKSKAEKDYFLGQLSDGWGEDVVHLEWPWRNCIRLCDATAIDVINTDEYRPERRESY